MVGAAGFSVGFTEGLDKNAINWVKQGTYVSPQPRSPLREKYPMDDPVANIPLCGLEPDVLRKAQILL